MESPRDESAFISLALQTLADKHIKDASTVQLRPRRAKGYSIHRVYDANRSRS